MKCPKCAAEFETLTHEGVEVDRCTGCGGVWLDAREWEALEQTADPAGIDTGTRRAGKAQDAVRSVPCPRCSVPMMSMADVTQFHIVYESCPQCAGTFFDAGELRDLSELTVIERVRKLLDQWLSVR